MYRDGYSGLKYSDKRKLLYNPVDYDFIQENLPTYVAVQELRGYLGLVDCFVAGRIGRADDHKFDLVAIDAIGLLRNKIPNFRFLLVGATEKITKYVSKLGLDDIVVYIEPISDFKELLKYYCLLDVFVAASAIGESFGMVIAEAMACGVPVVTISTPSKDNGQIELVDNGITGYVVDSYDRLICMAIMDLYVNTNMKSTLGNNSKNKIKQSYEASRIVYSMQDFILSKLCNNHIIENADSLIVGWNNTLIKEYKDRRKNLFQQPFLREIIYAKLEYTAKKCGFIKG
jgi:glycosyltransferase involved in cell wall biosynthesis